MPLFDLNAWENKPRGLDVYREVSDDWKDPDGDPSYLEGLVQQHVIERVLAAGGPFDGVELSVPPGGTSVVLPATFGDGDMHGQVIYERRGDRMVYVGQPDQTEAIAAEMSGREPRKLILPDG